MKCLTPIVIKNPKFLKIMPLSDKNPKYISVPCGKCYNCRRRRNRDWVARLLCEQVSYNTSMVWFITLTYDDNTIPFAHSQDLRIHIPTLVKKHIQDWKKRFKEQVKYHTGQSDLRFFIVGEYGKKSFRPHYHILLFNYEDRGNLQDFLRSTWKYGSHKIDSTNDKVMSYVTKYCMKEQFAGDRLSIFEDNFSFLDTSQFSGKTMIEIDNMESVNFSCWQRPFSLVTTKPALGRTWFDKNKDWLLNRLKSDLPPSLHFDGNTYPIPRLFVRWLCDEYPSLKNSRWYDYLDSQFDTDCDITDDVREKRLRKKHEHIVKDSNKFDNRHTIESIHERYNSVFVNQINNLFLNSVPIIKRKL